METSSEPKIASKPSAALLLPEVALASCIFGAFVRDTRGCSLPSDQRFNHFASSPFWAISWSFEGVSHLLETCEQISDPASAPQMSQVVLSGPQQTPRTSWNLGDTYAMTLCFYPETFSAMTGLSLEDYLHQNLPVEDVLAGDLLELCWAVLETKNANDGFQFLSKNLIPIWQDVRPSPLPMGNMVSDWSKSLAIKAATSSLGRSTRQIERRIKSWTGQSQRKLNAYAQNDEAFKHALKAQTAGELNIADISAQAGYADQSHMTRRIRSQTGFSPAELMKRIETDESLWSFRLLGQRY